MQTPTPLTSLDYARLLSWLAYYKHGRVLGKVQLQKLLYILFGSYLATYDKPLFTDDTPRVWPYGPVFPESYKHFKHTPPADLTEAEKQRFLQDEDALRLASAVAREFATYTATQLSNWAHLGQNPWARTLRDCGHAWNVVIPNEYIHTFFKDEELWREGL